MFIKFLPSLPEQRKELKRALLNTFDQRSKHGGSSDMGKALKWGDWVEATEDLHHMSSVFYVKQNITSLLCASIVLLCASWIFKQRKSPMSRACFAMVNSFKFYLLFRVFCCCQVRFWRWVCLLQLRWQQLPLQQTSKLPRLGLCENWFVIGCINSGW